MTTPPDMPAALKKSGDDCFRNGDYPSAIRYYLRAIEVDSSYIAAWNNLGYALSKSGRNEDAARCREKIAELQAGAADHARQQDPQPVREGSGIEGAPTQAPAAAVPVDGFREWLRLPGKGGNRSVSQDQVPAPAAVVQDTGPGTPRTSSDGFWEKLRLPGKGGNRDVSQDPVPAPAAVVQDTGPGTPRTSPDGFWEKLRLSTTMRRKGSGRKGSESLEPGCAGGDTGMITRSGLTGPEGPLRMEEGEVFSSANGEDSMDTPESREQIIAGFDRILAGSDIDPAGLRGLSYYAMGMYREALGAFAQEAQADREYPGIYVLEASALLKLGRTDEALRSCEQALSEGKDSFEVLNLYGEILESRGRYGEALDAFDRALLINPHAVDTWAKRAGLLHGQRRDHEALQSCDRALGMDPESPWLIRKKAAILADLGRADESIAILDQGIAADPRDSTLIFEKGRILHRAGHASEALKEFDHALAISPGDPRAWEALALVFRDLGSYPDEAAAWERAATLAPGTPSYLASAGDAHREAGDYALSVTFLSRAVRECPEDLSLWHRLGRNLSLAGVWKDAAEAYHYITERDPADTRAWECLASALMELGRMEEALAALKKAGAPAPDKPAVHRGGGSDPPHPPWLGGAPPPGPEGDGLADITGANAALRKPPGGTSPLDESPGDRGYRGGSSLPQRPTEPVPGTGGETGVREKGGRSP